MIVDNLHVSSSNMAVIRAIRKRLDPTKLGFEFRHTRHEIYRLALKRHAENRETYHLVMGGFL